MSLFTLSPSHIELPVASPLSLTRAHSLFFYHFIYLLHRVGDPVVFACYVWIRHEFQTWHTYSSLILHSSLWYFPLGHHFITIFLISHIITCDIRFLSFLSLLLTRHYSYFTLSGGFSHVTAWRIVTFFPIVHPPWAVVQRCYFERLSCWWGFMLHLYVERVWSFGYVFPWEFIHYWSEYAQKNIYIYIAHCSFYRSSLGMCMDVPGCFIEFIC